MSGVICLQGGAEFTEPCREMDATVLDRTAAGHHDRPVAVMAGAARVGDDYDAASHRAARHYESLGATVVVVPDPRQDPTPALAGLTPDIGLLVLPGGSPSSLIDVLLGSSALVGARMLELFERGTAISGASAGAMALADYCVLPDQSSRRRTAVAHGLGFVDGVVVPHWQPSTTRWRLPDEVAIWGLPECGGVLIDGDGTVEAVGAGEPSYRLPGLGWAPVIRGSDAAVPTASPERGAR